MCLSDYLMRNELLDVIKIKSNPKEVYGLDQNSIQQFVASINSVLQSRNKDKENIIAGYKEHYEEGVTSEVISDYAWYHELDNEYLKQYGIIRIIGVTEAIIDKRISKSQQGLPLTQKIAILDGNFDFSEIHKWIKLRNELVHRPFEHYYPTKLEMNDINECMIICLQTLTDLDLS